MSDILTAEQVDAIDARVSASFIVASGGAFIPMGSHAIDVVLDAYYALYRAHRALLAERSAPPIEGTPSVQREWGAPVEYLTDDRDQRDPEKRLKLVIMQGGNGDWYVSTIPESQRHALYGVRLSTSGGASSRVPGLTAAIVEAYRAMHRVEGTPSVVSPMTPEGK